MPKGSILVVDDEVEIREGLEALLTSEDFRVTLAETAAAGLQKLEEQPFDLVLLDVSLPDRNGLDLLREIQQRDPNLADHLDYGLRLDRYGARGVQERRAGLHHEAVVERRTDRAGFAGDRGAAAARRESSTSSAR